MTDSTGGVIQGAAVVATHVATSVTSTTTTNTDGVYTFSHLRDGPHTLSITAPGFREFVATEIDLVTRDVRRIDATLQVSALDSAVQVTSSVSAIDLETARVNDVRSADQLRTLPLNDPGVWSSLAISPMLSLRSGTYSFAGSRYNQSQFAIDGTTMSDGVGETPIGPLANFTESFREVKIDLANNTAEFSSLGQVTVISKSGTNRFHGAVFDYYQSPRMRAKNPFSRQRPEGVMHFPGLALGGPWTVPRLYDGRGRTFWFVSAETVSGSSASVDLDPTVPVAAWRRGDFSGLGRPIRNPFSGEVYPDGRIPASVLNPVALSVQDRFYPLPNVGNTDLLEANNFRQTLAVDPVKPYYGTARVDHNFNERDRLFGRLTLHQATNRVWEGNLPAFGMRHQLRQSKALTLSYTRILGPTLVTEFRFGHTYNNNSLAGPLRGLEVVESLGLTGLAPGLPDINGMLKVSFPGSGLTGLSQVDWSSPGFLNRINQFHSQTTWQAGTHTVKVGAETRRIDWEQKTAPSSLFGNIEFTGRFTAVPGVPASGHPYADFLFGVPTTAARAFPPIGERRRRWTYDFFVHDDWKVTRDLTIGFGLRYDLHPGWFERDDRLAFFDLASGRIVIPDGGLAKVSPRLSPGYVEIVTASALGLPSRALVLTDSNNVAPRLSVAFRPFGDAQTVIRGGYGVYYDMAPIDLWAGRAPFVIDETTFTNPTSPTLVLPTVFPPAGTGGPATTDLPLAANPALQLPYSHQWSATIEHERWNTGFRVSYVATLGRAMWYTRDANAPEPDARLYIDKPRPYPKYPSLPYADSGATHDYHGVTFEAERRLTNGLFFQIAYTAARDNGEILQWQTPIENPFDLKRERGRDTATPTHRMSTAAIYDLPFGRERRWLTHAPRLIDMAIGAWQLSVVGHQQTGGYFTPTITLPDPTGTRFTTAATRPIVTLRPDQSRDPSIDDPTTAGWYDVTAFAAPPIGRFGTARRGAVQAPGLNVWHVGLHKRFRLADGADAAIFRIEVTATNVFNKPQWATPNLNVTPTNVTAGRVTAVGGSAGFIQQADMRRLRVGFRLEW